MCFVGITWRRNSLALRIFDLISFLLDLILFRSFGFGSIEEIRDRRFDATEGRRVRAGVDDSLFRSSPTQGQSKMVVSCVDSCSTVSSR